MIECPYCDGRGGDGDEQCALCLGQGQLEHYCRGCGETDHDHDQNEDCPRDSDFILHDLGRRGEGVTRTEAAAMGAFAFKVSSEPHPGVLDDE